MALIQNSQMLKEISDDSWIRQSLLVPKRGGINNVNARVQEMQKAGQFSVQELNFADTSLGGNRSINPRPQFTRFSDSNLPSLLSKVTNTGKPDKASSMGMGRYYAEAMDANAQRINMQFGVPAFNSLTNFFSTFYDGGHGKMANSGEADDGILYTLGQAAGFITVWSVVPELALGALIYRTAKSFLADAQHRPLSKFYYMKPTMTLYWSTVQTIVNALTVNMKLTQGVGEDVAKRQAGERISYTNANATNYLNLQLNGLLPDIFYDANGGIDIRGVANRYERLADAHEKKLIEIRNSSSTAEDVVEKLKLYLGNRNSGNWAIADKTTEEDFNKNYNNSASGKGSHLVDKMPTNKDKIFSPTTQSSSMALPMTSPDNVAEGTSDDTETVTILGTPVKWWNGLMKHVEEYWAYGVAEARDGSAFVSFIVDYESHSSESFSSSSRESDVASKINSTAGENRAKLFNIANGNIGDNLIADTAEALVEGAKSVLQGMASSVGLSGLSALGGAAFADIPEFWQSSTTILPSSSYSIQLRSPYGNPISILTNIYVPLAMLIAGAAPRSAGRNSYTSPFLCKIWQKGRTQVALGLITSLSITRGTGNSGWSINQLPLGVDVNFTITNLSKLLHVPITTNLSVSEVLGITMFDEDTNFTDYMAVLGSLGLAEQYYASSRWALRRARARQNFDTYFSMSHFIQWGVENTYPGSIMSFVAKQGFIN